MDLNNILKRPDKSIQTNVLFVNCSFKYLIIVCTLTPVKEEFIK